MPEHGRVLVARRRDDHDPRRHVHPGVRILQRQDRPPSDGGAGIWAETILRTREACPDMSVEVLIPDFEGNWGALQLVIDARPHIINHNLETVSYTHLRAHETPEH